MPVVISSVGRHSIASRHGLKDGFTIEKINGHEINDVLDYRFYIRDSRLEIAVRDSKGRQRTIKLRKKEEDELGLEFETYLMDCEKRCKNKCVFCFIDQLPKGMRESLYFKDDDSRLSFFFGNYITLTNLSEHDVNRIIEMHISPVNISVHTMNPKLRVKMMKNKRAGECLSIMKRFAEAGIEMNTQLVLCPGINDGKELEFSLNELGKLYPAVRSIAAVPVGLTKHREGLPELKMYDKKAAGEVIDIINCFADHFQYFHGTRLAFPADEFYIQAERKIPDASFYEDFAQLEDGVGLLASLKDEFYSAIDSLDGNFTLPGERNVSIATGCAAYPLIQELSSLAESRVKGLKVSVNRIINDFFGENITVAGLIVGGDLINQLKGKELGEELLIPSVMLRHEGDMFLDSVTLEEAEKELKIKITVSETDGYDLLDKILGKEGRN